MCRRYTLHELGVYLGLSYQEIRAAITNYSDSFELASFNMLHTWLENQHSRQEAFMKFITALNKSGLSYVVHKLLNKEEETTIVNTNNEGTKEQFLIFSLKMFTTLGKSLCHITGSLQID